MEKEPLNFSICNQKGGVGKSTLTVFAASWLHYVLGRNVLVVDCDYPNGASMANVNESCVYLNEASITNSCCCDSFDNPAANSGLWCAARP